MPPKKAPKANAYLLFLRDMEGKHPEWKGKNTKEIVDHFAPQWDALNDDEKQKYKDRARERRAKVRERYYQYVYLLKRSV